LFADHLSCVGYQAFVTMNSLQAASESVIPVHAIEDKGMNFQM